MTHRTIARRAPRTLVAVAFLVITPLIITACNPLTSKTTATATPATPAASLNGTWTSIPAAQSTSTSSNPVFILRQSGSAVTGIVLLSSTTTGAITGTIAASTVTMYISASTVSTSTIKYQGTTDSKFTQMSGLVEPPAGSPSTAQPQTLSLTKISRYDGISGAPTGGQPPIMGTWLVPTIDLTGALVLTQTGASLTGLPLNNTANGPQIAPGTSITGDISGQNITIYIRSITTPTNGILISGLIDPTATGIRGTINDITTTQTSTATGTSVLLVKETQP